MPKTLDDLAKQVMDTQAGLMSVEDLKVLFEEVPQVQNPIQQTPVEPVAPTPQVPAEPTVQPTEPVLEKPSILGIIPDKFKDVDEKTSVEKLAKSYAELEAELKKSKGEKEELAKLVNTLSSTPQVTEPIQPSIPGTPSEEVDDTLFFEKPGEASRKIATQVAANMLMAYHQSILEAQKRIKFVEEFKATHPDFETYREDVAFVLRARPDLDKSYTSLPAVYEMAKHRYATRVDKMKESLGLQPQTEPAQPAKPAVDDAALVERVKAVLVEEIKKRRAASGIQGGSTPSTPATRTEPVVKTVPKTPEDEIFEEMLKSGPARLKLGE